MNEKIRSCYFQIKDKKVFCNHVGGLIGREGATIYTHWFTLDGIYIPERFMYQVLKELEKWLEKQIKDEQRALDIKVIL